ncbi:MAG: 30S ribosomal protein S6 [Acidimicrobiia bacterium]|nr:30S ribosomal protein S6 [Acidimicrobiia bacterium]MDH4308040.1 30S ribosomal protein S6 [Acidimicrobiia bacterium]MDH5294527.1 30S ribosomal protein S6 [Acidimicrobiia bacterium]
MRTYELMTIHRPALEESDVRDRVTDVEKYLENAGGKVTSTDIWGKRRFAYEIDHLSEGYYTVVTFEAETEAVDGLDRMLSLSDEVLRHKVVRPGA